jgi:hypothetical protein
MVSFGRRTEDGSMPGYWLLSAQCVIAVRSGKCPLTEAEAVGPSARSELVFMPHSGPSFDSE